MIKVVKHGRISPIYQVKCRFCNAIIQYTENEEKLRFIGSYEAYRILCPDCKQWTSTYGKHRGIEFDSREVVEIKNKG